MSQHILKIVSSILIDNINDNDIFVYIPSIRKVYHLSIVVIPITNIGLRPLSYL